MVLISLAWRKGVAIQALLPLLLALQMLQIAWAQAPMLPLQQALGIAEQANIDFLNAQEQVTRSQAQANSAYSRLWPSLTLIGSRSERLYSNDGRPEDSSYRGQFQFSQTLFDANIWADWKKAELEFMRAELALLRQQQQLHFSVKSAWYQLFTDQLLALEAKDSLARLAQHRDNAKYFYENGSIWRNDLLQAEVRVARGQQIALDADNQVLRSQSALNRLLNRNILTAITLPQSLPIQDYTDTLGSSIQKALADRPDIQRQSMNVAIAYKDRLKARSGYFPTLNAQVNDTRNANSIDFTNNNNDTQLQLNLRWTLWDSLRTKNEISRSQADLRISKNDLHQLKEVVQQETQTAWLAVQSAKHNIKVLTQALNQAQENYRVTEIRYKEQLSTANDVLDAQDLLTSTRTDMAQAKGNYLSAIAQLHLAMGSRPE